MSQQHGAREDPASSRPDASMWLLHQVTEHTLDRGYEEAAARRAAGQPTPPAGRFRIWLLAGVVLTAMVVTAGAVDTRRNAPEADRERQELLAHVESGAEEVEHLATEVDGLRDHVADLRRDALRDEGGTAELTALLAGAIAVTGPGIELLVDDAEGSGQDAGGAPREGPSFADTGRLRDRDLQRLVNGLWEAGADAVSVNGQRLTGVSAIRAAGDAVLVGNRPLGPPYTIQAIGDGEELREAFTRSQGGATLRSLEEHYGIRATLTVEEELRLPAASDLALRDAVPYGAVDTEADGDAGGDGTWENDEAESADRPRPTEPAVGPEQPGEDPTP